jgi:hypothetical protein
LLAVVWRGSIKRNAKTTIPLFNALLLTGIMTFIAKVAKKQSTDFDQSSIRERLCWMKERALVASQKKIQLPGMVGQHTPWQSRGLSATIFCLDFFSYMKC